MMCLVFVVSYWEKQKASQLFGPNGKNFTQPTTIGKCQVGGGTTAKLYSIGICLKTKIYLEVIYISMCM